MRGISEEKLKKVLFGHYWGSCTCEELLDNLLDECTELNQWMPIETAPKDKSLMLCCSVAKYDTQLIYCGRYRIGTLGEPQAHVIAWRCDSSGRFSNPTHWMPLPPVPTGEQTDNNPESIG